MGIDVVVVEGRTKVSKVSVCRPVRLGSPGRPDRLPSSFTREHWRYLRLLSDSVLLVKRGRFSRGEWRCLGPYT